MEVLMKGFEMIEAQRDKEDDIALRLTCTCHPVERECLRNNCSIP